MNPEHLKNIFQCGSNQTWKKDLCRCECKCPTKHYACEKHYFWNPNASAYEIDKCLKSITGNSVIKCDEIMETVGKLYYSVSGDVLINWNDKKATCEMGYFILLTIFTLFY